MTFKTTINAQTQPRHKGVVRWMEGMMADFGWRNIKVRNEDGRNGVIVREREDFLSVHLEINVNNGSTAIVSLDCQNTDYGERGWKWFCANFDGGPKWLWLGDHN